MKVPKEGSTRQKVGFQAGKRGRGEEKSAKRSGKGEKRPEEKQRRKQDKLGAKTKWEGPKKDLYLENPNCKKSWHRPRRTKVPPVQEKEWGTKRVKKLPNKPITNEKRKKNRATLVTRRRTGAKCQRKEWGTGEAAAERCLPELRDLGKPKKGCAALLV